MTKRLIDSKTAKRIAIESFNHTWDIIDKPEKSADDLLEMIKAAHASLYFWQLVEDHTPTNLSIGYWQLSRVYALAGDGTSAILHGKKCVEISLDHTIDTFYLAYAYEALARGFILEKKYEIAKTNIQKAREVLTDSKETELNMLIIELQDLENSMH